MKILIVDDNPEDRRMLRYVAERNGHQAIEAVNGADGLEKARSMRPDMIFSDALMPVMDGFQFLRQVKQDDALRLIPFFFYSASYTENQDVRLALSLGAEDYLIKPMEPGDLLKKIEEVSRGEKSEGAEFPLVHEDAEYLKRYSEVVATKLEEKVRQLEENIEERKLVEESLRQSEEFVKGILESVDEGFIVIDPDFRIKMANRAYIESFSGSANDIIGRHCYEISHHTDRPCFERGEDCAPKKAFFTGKPASAVHTHPNADGRDAVVLETKAYPMKDKAGRVHSVIEVLVNVTEKMKLEEQLRHAQMLEALGTLAGGIAHDFNNILTPILGYADMALLTIPQDIPAFSEIQEVLNAGNRAKELVKQILTFCRQSEQEIRPLKIQYVIKEALKLLRASIPATIEFKQRIDQECPAVLADPTQIHQIVMNLCTNAYHAMRETGGVLGVSVAPVKLGPADLATKLELIEGPYIRLEVSDTGPGMDKIVSDRIFDPYYTTKSKGEGTGLGLSIVLGIVKGLHGAISVYSEPGHGTCFQVYFPVVAESTMENAERLSELRLPQGDEHIMVVDDDEAIAQMEKLMLERLGYSVIAFANCQEALQTFQATPDRFDLIITDFAMPKITGAQLAKEVHVLRPDLPVILCTGFSELMNGENAKAREISEFIMKPVSRRDLATAVRKVLDAV